MNPLSPQRIMIFGLPGSGKSTFALQLHQLTGLPLYHLDRYFFTSHWQERPAQEFLNWQQEIVHRPQWIIDGNCIHSLDMRYQRADLILYFHPPKWRCVGRLIKRRFLKNPYILDRAPHCPEKLRWRLLRYLWTFEKRLASPLKRCQVSHPLTPFWNIQSTKDLKRIRALLKRGNFL